jgi:hypothetical protein
MVVRSLQSVGDRSQTANWERRISHRNAPVADVSTIRDRPKIQMRAPKTMAQNPVPESAIANNRFEDQRRHDKTDRSQMTWPVVSCFPTVRSRSPARS